MVSIAIDPAELTTQVENFCFRYLFGDRDLLNRTKIIPTPIGLAIRVSSRIYCPVDPVEELINLWTCVAGKRIIILKPGNTYYEKRGIICKASGNGFFATKLDSFGKILFNLRFVEVAEQKILLVGVNDPAYDVFVDMIDIKRLDAALMRM